MDALGSRVYPHAWCLRSLALVLAALALASCRTHDVAVVERVRTDTCYITRLQRDSIRLHDSIYVREYARAESVFVEVERWHTAYRDRVLRDTIYLSRVDSVPVPYEVERVVYRMRWWQKSLMFFGLLILFVSGFLMWKRLRL